jgi:hypothetical protein
MSRMDRSLKWLGLINGIVLLVVLLVAGGLMAAAALSELLYDSGDPVRVPDESGQAGTPRAVRMSTPKAIRGTTSRLIEISHGRGELESSPALYDVTIPSSYEVSYTGPIVNVAFIDAEQSAGRLLLDVPAVVLEVDYPQPNDTMHVQRRWIAYRIITEDTNRNGELEDEDRPGLYVSGLDGRGFKRILASEMWPETVMPVGDGSQMLIHALQGSTRTEKASQDRLPQRVLVYDQRTDKVEPVALLDSLSRRAGSIVSR